MKSFITTGIALFIFSACFSQQEPTGWRGPARDGVFPEKNLLTSWPAGGPGLLWSFEGLGYYVNGYGVVFCFDAANGDIRWKRDLLNECEGQTRSWGLQVLIAAENMLYSYDYKGNFKLLKPLEDRVEIVGSFVVSGGSNEHFSHPVIKDGRLYIRHENSLLVYNISKTDNKIVGSGMPTMLKGRS